MAGSSTGHRDSSQANARILPGSGRASLAAALAMGGDAAGGGAGRPAQPTRRGSDIGSRRAAVAPPGAPRVEARGRSGDGYAARAATGVPSTLGSTIRGSAAAAPPAEEDEEGERFEREVAEVMSQLLARARGASSQAPPGSRTDCGARRTDVFGVAQTHPVEPAAGVEAVQAPGRHAEMPSSGRGSSTRRQAGGGPAAQGGRGAADAVVRAGEAGADNAEAPQPNLAAVASLQARVEQRAARLQLDMQMLAARKRELLLREVGSELEKEAEEDMQRQESILRARAEAAMEDVRAAIDVARGENRSILEEIDAHLRVLDRVKAEAEAQRLQQQQIWRSCTEALVDWVNEAKVAQLERIEQRAEADVRWLWDRGAALMPEDPWPSA